SDLFSLGSVLYALCAGHAPFRADMTMAVLRRVCAESPRPLREVNADVPGWLAAVVARLHAKNPAERFQTAAEAAHPLTRHVPFLKPRGTDPPERSTPLAEPRTQRGGGSGPPAKAASSARRLAVCAALIAGGVIAAYWIFWRPEGARTPDGANNT